jgi:hypothetical protein
MGVFVPEKRLIESIRPAVLAILIALLVFVSIGSAGIIRPTNATAATLSISVVGNHFVDGNGATIRLLGLNRSGTEYMCTGGGSLVFDGPSDDASIAVMASWHINIVRLPLNEDCWLGINGFPASMTSAAYKQAIVNYVNLLHNHGLYAILDLQWNAPGTQSTGLQVMADADHAPAFWTSLATTFKADPGVLLDLYNEPHVTSWACWRDGCMDGFQTAGMQSLITAVRNTGATQPLLVGGNNSSSDFAQWLSFRPTDPLSQLIAGFHNYDFTGCAIPCSTSAVLPVAASVPIVIGELGESDCTHAYIDPYMAWADTNGLSYLGWAWNTYDCGTFPSLISNFNGTPTNFGIGFRDHLAALAGSPATVTLLAPNTGPAVGATPVTITGTNFSGVTAVKFGTVAASAYSVNGTTQITATSPAGTGTVDVRVTTAAGTSALSSADQFTYGAPPPAPTVSAVAPNSGLATGATPVTITGANFSGVTSVRFGAVAAATYTVNSSTQITATSPAGSGAVDVTVTTAGGTSATSAADQFTYIAAPTVSSVAPTSGPAAGGTSVTIMGTNLTGATAVKFGTVAASGYTVDSSNQITATSPAGSGIADVRVTTPGGTSAASAADHFTFITPPPPAPTVGLLAPMSGPAGGGTPVTITGTNFTGATAVMFGGSTVSFAVISSTQITATSPAGSGTVDLTVTTTGGTSSTSSADLFTFIPAPAVSSVGPASGPAAGGTSVTITGANLAGAAGVKFGSVPATTFTVDSASQITATSPAGSGIADVRVTTPGGTSAMSAADHFTYVAPPPPTPTVSLLSPTTGPAAGGTPVTITGTNFTGATAVSFGGVTAAYTFNTSTQITATSPAGFGSVDVTVTAAGGTSSTSSADQFAYVAAPTPCTSMTASASPASPQATGTGVTFTAGASGCPNPRYQFYTLAPGGSWTLTQAYSSSATFNWSTTGLPAGVYHYSVWVRDASSTAVYDAYFAGTTYTLTSTSTTCTSVSAAAGPASPQTAGTPVAFTSSSTSCSNPRYQFWILAPGGSWTIAQPYSSSSTFNWTTTMLPAGTYNYSVWVRDASSAGSYDAYTGTTYTLMSTACASVTASASPASPQLPGTSVTFTGSASGCPNPRYQFWTLAPGGSWTIAQPYSSSATFNWNTSGLSAGTYNYSVWVRDASSAAGYDAYTGNTYTLTSNACTSVTASAAPTSPQAPGTSVTLTASAMGCPNPRYQFWILAPGGSWGIAQAYSTNATFNWVTAGLFAGIYHYSVWVRDASSGAGYDAYTGNTFTLTSTPCASVTASTAPASPQARGTTVAFTASASGCPNPLYQFWILAPGGSWTIVRGYSGGAVFNWITTALPAGTYHYSVWVRDATSGTAYDAYFSGTAYVLT